MQINLQQVNQIRNILTKLFQKKNVEETVPEKEVPKEKDPQVNFPKKT